MNKKLKRKQALIMAEPYRTPFNSKVAKVSGDVIEDSVGVIKYATSFNGATKIVDGNKNLLSLPNIEETTQNGVTYSIKDGVITLNGTTTGIFELRLENIVEVEENQTYYFYQKTENTVTTFNLVSDIGHYSAEPTFFLYNNKSKKMTKTGYLTLHLYITNTTTFTNAKFYLMLVLGTTAPTTFEPYFKNLLEFNDKEGATDNGITYSIKNGVITFSATPFETIRNMTFHFNAIGINIGDTYSIALFNQFTSTIGFFVQDKGNAEGNIYLGINENIVKTWTVTTGSQYEAIVVYLDKNKTYTNEVIKPILVSGSTIPTQFIPFANPYFVSLGQNGSVRYNGLEPREIDLKGNVISKINNQASDKLSNYALTKNTKVVDLGSLTWDVVPTSQANIIRYRSEDLRYEAVFPTSNSTIANILCVKYDTVSRNDSYERLIKGISLDYQYNLIIYDPEYNTSDKLEAFKKAIRGTLLMYQVKNPTTINTTSFKTFKEDTNATISDDNFTSSPNAITETFKPTRSYDFKVNGFSNVIKSSNLLNLTDKADTTINGITYSIKNGVITLNGTSTETTFILLINGLSGRYYSVNGFNNASTDDLQILYGVNGVAWNTVNLGTANASKSIDFLEEQINIEFTIRINPNTSLTNATVKPMLVSGSTIPTKYEPYFDPYIESFADKKNLLNLPIKSGTINNVSYNISQGNVLTLNGTMSNASNYIMVNDLNLVLEKGIYTFAITKDMFINNISCAIILGTTDGDLIFTIQGKNTSITTILPSKTTINYLRMWINPTTFNNYQTSLMLIHGKTAPTTFLPYQDKYSAFLNVKGKNLLEFENQSGTIPAGISYNVKNQIITLNGTAKVDGWVWFPFETTLNGTYSFKVITSKPISSSTTNKARISLDNPGIAGQVLVYLHQSSETTVELNNFTCKRIGINSPINETWDDMQFSLILVEGDKIPEFEPYYSFTKEVLIKQPLRKFDYLTYDGVYRQTNEIVLDGTNNIYVDDKGKIFLLKIPNADSVGKNWFVNVASEIMVTTSNLPLLPYYNISRDNQMGIGTNQGNIILRLDDSSDNSLNNWTVEKVNNYFKQNPITITYKTVDQTFEATSLTRLLLKNGYNKITAYDSINNNAIVEYLEYYKSK